MRKLSRVQLKYHGNLTPKTKNSNVHTACHANQTCGGAGYGGDYLRSSTRSSLARAE